MEKWEKRWEQNQLRWHNNDVDPWLIKYLLKFHEQDKTEEKQTKGRAKRFFVPLCGKSVDIPYILSLGYGVFAVEGVRRAIEILNEENNFGLIYNEQDSIYHSPDDRLQIYHGDLFTCPVEKWGPFDYIWDKGSLTAIDESCRPLYKEALQKSVRLPDSDEYYNFQYLLRTVIYDKTKSDGRGPKCVSETDMSEIYGDWANIKLLESSPLPDSHILRKNADIGLVCHENVYLLTRKSC